MQFKKQEKLIDIALKAAYLAGVEILKIYNQHNFKIEYKADNSPLTIADKSAHSIIAGLLEQTQIPIISEEGYIPEYQIRRYWKHCWLVDPLDGTKEFIKRNGEFTVNIALIEDGKPILGVIYAPEMNSTFFAYNKTLYVIENHVKDFVFDDIGSILAKHKHLIINEKSKQKYCILTSRSHKDAETEKFIENLKSEHQNIEIISIGSSLKFCMLAVGKADIYPKISATTMEWDTAAGQAIVEAAGGKVVDPKSGLPLVYNKENLRNSSFIASINT